MSTSDILLGAGVAILLVTSKLLAKTGLSSGRVGHLGLSETLQLLHAMKT